MLKYGKPYADAGVEYYEERYRQRVVAALTRRASAMGFSLLPTTELEILDTGTTVRVIELPLAQ
ncbi:MAG TPA: hypothetical protein VGX78_11450 [Pirellulales bacterium]|jgi:hypothetical protein|nr:hypothetical protein [Pirellulales bacterium]